MVGLHIAMGKILVTGEIGFHAGNGKILIAAENGIDTVIFAGNEMAVLIKNRFVRALVVLKDQVTLGGPEYGRAVFTFD